MAQRSPRQSLFSIFSFNKSGSNSSEPKSRNGKASQPQPRRRSRHDPVKTAPRRSPSTEPRQNNDLGRSESFEPLLSQLRQKPVPPKSRKRRPTPGKRPPNAATGASVLPFGKPADPSPRRRPEGDMIPAPTSPLAPRDKLVKRVRKKRRVSPIIYVARLVILGLGIGVISGTILSVLNALGRSSAAADQTVNLSLEQQQNSTSSNALVSSLQLTQESSDLKTAILGLAKDLPKLKPGVFLVDLDTGNYVDIQGQEAVPAASTIKLPILVSFFQAVDEGRIRLDEVLTMEEKHVAKGSGELQDKPVGSKFTALETADLMITNSDNTATNMLIDRLGGIESLNQQFASWQLKQTQMQNILPDLEGTNKTSARDLVNLMADINRGKLVSLKSRDFMLRIMQQTRNRSLLPRGLGDGAFIAHKTGNIDSVSGDVGLIDMPNGKRYLVGVLVQREADDPQANELIRKISSTIYQYFDTATDPKPNPDLPTTPDQVQDNQQ
ncbi:Beta-lactamase TEM-12 [Planktothrix agardhii]|uniref:Penicillin-binding protein, transpeptidase n=1 Tax=Planktothrix agardhii TaxID=1160 RepID=A0A1J1JGN3_PLAAG|nr:serine hydrolase [Planktothrix agardhii]MCF3577375.1 serine hydrolase [Planktothrix agardhii 1812]MCF3578921.1 serine hydrolase [Planktothrix agardhii 1811]MCF3579360.1 serine hydrolase [Planktothrix agardhii 1811]MCF3623369.1 serine hydrolase [Planktothrix agardhii 1801]CAD5938632.1 Beta-lactamase TEM-12 [Planktothrix agardhii]